MNAVRRRRKPIPLEVSCQIRALHQIGGMKGSDLVRRFPQYSRASLYRHAKKPLDGTDRIDRRHRNRGRPRKLNDRDLRQMRRQIGVLREQRGTFSSRRLQLSTGATHVRYTNLIVCTNQTRITPLPNNIIIMTRLLN